MCPDDATVLPAAPSNIYLAYDGSINGDWVARYAMNMAGNTIARRINLIQILDGSYDQASATAKINALTEECAGQGIELTPSILPLERNVCASLLAAIPSGADTLCICGTRITSRGKGFLAGTISEKLLRHKQFNVLAIRVVKPGILGLPRELLFPLSGHPRGLQAAMTFLRLVAPQAERLHLLRVMQVSRFWFQYMPVAKARALRAKGIAYMDEILADIRERHEALDLLLDAKVVLSDDWVKEILIHASKTHAQMIIMGASDRNLPSRYFYGNKIEQILRQSPCDIGIYRKL